MSEILRLNEFFIEGGDQNKSHVLLHVTEPSNSDERDKGYFFAACEINNAETKHILKLQNIIEEIENSYYETKDEEDKTALEVVLEKINSKSYSLQDEEVNLNCIVGTICHDNIIFSLHGEPLMFLFYKRSDGTYSTMDLTEQNKDSEINKKQLFSQIIQGKLKKDDFLFSGTPHISKYFDQDRLLKILTTRPVRQGADHINRVLTELKNNLSFGGLIIKLENNTSKFAKKEKLKEKQSINKLFVTEKNTAQILNSSLMPNINKKIRKIFNNEKNIKNSLPNNLNREKETNHRTNTKNKKIKKTRQTLDQEVWIKIWQILKKITKLIITILISIFTVFYTILGGLTRQITLFFFVLTNYQGRRRNIIENWSRTKKSYIENFKQLSTSTKILLFISILISLIFISSLVFLSAKQKTEVALEKHKINITNIRSKLDNMEGALIYGNEEIVFEEIQNVKKLLNNLNHEKYPEDCNNLNEELNKFIKKVSKISTVEAEKITDLTTYFGIDYFNKIIQVGNKIIIFGTNTSTVAFYDLLSKELKNLKTQANGFIAGSVPKENDYALLLTDKNELYKFDPRENSLKKVEVYYPQENIQINSIVVYNRKLYTLDSQNKQIYKHTPIQSGFGTGIKWTKTGITELSDNIDMAIDGDIYTLKQNGIVTKITTGNKVNFTISRLIPPLQNADKIWTYNNLNYIYILDSLEKRLIILKNDGVFYKQLTSEKFNKPTGLIVNEATGTVYTLDQNRLFKINI